MSTGPAGPQEGQVTEQPSAQTIGEGAPQPQIEKKPFSPDQVAVVKAIEDREKASREQFVNLKTQAELLGFTVNTDGTITPPQPAQTPQQVQQPQYIPQPPVQGQFGPQAQALADRLGVRPEELVGVIQEAAGPIAQAYGGPMAEGIGTVYEQVLRQDPYWDVVKDEYHSILKNLVPAQLRGHPATLMQAFEMAKGRKTEAIATKIAEARANPGRTVGQFVEGASPGAGTGSGAPPLAPEYDKYTSDLSADAKARIAERIARRK